MQRGRQACLLNEQAEENTSNVMLHVLSLDSHVSSDINKRKNIV